MTLKGAKKLFPIEVSTAWMTWALLCRRLSSSELDVPPSPCKSVQESTEEGGDQHPVILCPRCRDAWSGIEPGPPCSKGSGSGTLSYYNRQSGQYWGGCSYSERLVAAMWYIPIQISEKNTVLLLWVQLAILWVILSKQTKHCFMCQAFVQFCMVCWGLLVAFSQGWGYRGQNV